MKAELRIRMGAGNEFVVPSAQATDTILKIKERIWTLKKFEVEQQMISLPKDKQQINDNLKLSEIFGLALHPPRVLQLTIFHKMIPLRIIRPEKLAPDLIIKTFPCCSIHSLKGIIEKHTHIVIEDQVLSYNGVQMKNENLLIDYNIKDPEDGLNLSAIEESRATTTSRPYEISLLARRNIRGKISLGIDFSFNTIKNVKKVHWKKTSPWYREVTDGASWFCYCRNVTCEIANELFIINKGYGVFYIQREIKEIRCPICKKGLFEMRNIGLVFCQWTYKGTLAHKKDNRISGEGRTYDKKLYTFKEANYNTMWEALEISVKELERAAILRNLSSESFEENKKCKDDKEDSPPRIVIEAQAPPPPSCSSLKKICAIF